MNDDIKLMLNIIKDVSECKMGSRNGLMILSCKDYKTLLYYITNLQQIEQDHKETNATLMSELAKLEEENEDNLRCIKSLKEQLESVINENQKLLEKWYKNNDNIVNLISENERLKENAIHNDKVVDKAKWNEMIYKSRCEKGIEYINTHKVSDTITFPLMKREQENQVKSCFDYEFEQAYKKDLLNILQNGSDSQ